LWNAAFELRHRIADINVNRFDVIRRGGVHIRVTENPLDDYVVDTQAVQITSKPTASSVPAVPLG
jgi:hypothetical protein